MKQFYFCVIAFLFISAAYSQKRIQVKNQRFEIQAIRNNEPVNLDTRDFGLHINYETGELVSQINIKDSRLYSDEEVEYRIPGDEIIKINGIFPLQEILYNRSADQLYNYELNVEHTGNRVTTNFEFRIANRSYSQGSFKVFRVQGMIDLRDFGIVDLKGYEPLVNLVMEFQAFVIGG